MDLNELLRVRLVGQGRRKCMKGHESGRQASKYDFTTIELSV